MAPEGSPRAVVPREALGGGAGLEPAVIWQKMGGGRAHVVFSMSKKGACQKPPILLRTETGAPEIGKPCEVGVKGKTLCGASQPLPCCRTSGQSLTLSGLQLAGGGGGGVKPLALPRPHRTAVKITQQGRGIWE